MLDRLFLQVEIARHLLVRLALRDQLEDVLLALGQLADQLGRARLLALARAHRGQEPGRQRRLHIGPARGDLVEDAHQFRTAHALEHIAARPGFQRFHHVVIGLRCGQHHHGGAGESRADAPGCGDPAARHGDIDERQRGSVRSHQLHCLIGGSALGHHPKPSAFVQRAHHPVAVERVIVDQHD